MADKKGASGFLKTPPVMNDKMSYDDWRSEVELWSQITEVPKTKQGGSLFFTLKDDARDTVRSKLKNEVIASDVGLTKILEALDDLYLKDSNQRSFNAYEEFVKYRREPGTSIRDFMVQFNIKYNKIKSHNMELPEGVLAYNLLMCANLTEEQQQLCRATTSDFTYEKMKLAIEKVAVSQNTSTATNSLYSEPQFEESYYGHDEEEGNSNNHHYHAEDTFYSRGNWNSYPHSKNNSQNNPPTLNPKDSFGKPSSCSFCHSVYHWLNNCPHAPASMKFTRGRSSQRRGNSRQFSWRGRGRGKQL